MKKHHFLLSLLICLLIPFHPLIAQDANDPKTIVEQWLKGIDAGKYLESHATTSYQIRKLVQPQNWANAVGSVRSPLGKNISRKILTMQPLDQLPDGSRGTYLVVQMLSQFQDNIKAIETITLVMDPDGLWRPGGYYLKKVGA